MSNTTLAAYAARWDSDRARQIADLEAYAAEWDAYASALAELHRPTPTIALTTDGEESEDIPLTIWPDAITWVDHEDGSRQALVMLSESEVGEGEMVLVTVLRVGANWRACVSSPNETTERTERTLLAAERAIRADIRRRVQVAA